MVYISRLVTKFYILVTRRMNREFITDIMPDKRNLKQSGVDLHIRWNRF